jgi:hypothetical protein
MQGPQTSAGSVTVVDAHSRPRPASPTFRRPRSGEEQELLDWFLEQALRRVPRGHAVTVFREPRVESAFPDLVIVAWKPSIARDWSAERLHLRMSDMRLVHYLWAHGPRDLKELRQVFPRSLTAALERVLAADLVRRVGVLWTPRAISRTFAATRIIAIEAKMKHWSGAVEQACLNTWFASSSYVLVPRVPRGATVPTPARMLGVGVLTQHSDALDTLWSRVDDLPRSYASWLFNDWAWRASHTGLAWRPS